MSTYAAVTAPTQFLYHVLAQMTIQEVFKTVHQWGEGMTRLGLFFGDQSAVAVRIGTRLSSAKLALRSRRGSAGWTRDCNCLCEAEFLLHVENNASTHRCWNGQF
jgi:hypothetical protein